MWKIMCDNKLFGEYPSEHYARAAFTSATQTRPKNSYRFVLLDPNDRFVDEKQSQIKGAVIKRA
jgi:hypothetical protein